MSFQHRAGLINELQKVRNSIVITYVTSTRPGLESQMAMDAIRRVHRQLEKIKTSKSKTTIDLFIHSNGGDGIVPWKLVTLIREYCNEFNVLVPNRAFSAATLTALGADNIFMHKMGMLGPTDPNVKNEFNPTHPTNPSDRIGISVEDVFSFISFVKEDVGITHEDELVKALELLAGEQRIHPLAIGNVKRFYAQSRMMATKLLELHMDKNTDAHRITELANNLNSKLYFHGHPINRDEAIDMGLKVVKPSPKLEEAIWKLYEAYEKDMELEEVFNPVSKFKQQYPSIPFPTPQNPVSVERLELEMMLACVEGTEESYSASTKLLVEGGRIMNQTGIQDILNVTPQKDGEWGSESI